MTHWRKRTFGDDQIIPGERMGGFTLGSQPADFIPADTKATLAEWSAHCNVGVEMHETQGLVDASTGDPRYRTAEGFHVGSALQDIVKAWGPPDSERPLEGEGLFDILVTYTRRGAGFAVKDGKVLYLSVFIPDREA